MKTEQIKFWEGKFGKDYSDRNTMDHEAWKKLHDEVYGINVMGLYSSFIGHLPRDSRILEVGCNTGQQLEAMQMLGFTNLYGVEVQWYAVERSKELYSGINVVCGSGFDIPFKDNYFELVFTSGVLIHIAPDDHKRIMREIYRCSRNLIMGFEYYAEEVTDIGYRGNEGFLWKADYSKIYQESLPGLQEVQRRIIPYVTEAEKGNKDCLFLLQKT